MASYLSSALLILCSVSSWAQVRPSYYPVILVPDLYSSQLYAKLDKPSVVSSRCINITEDFVPLWAGSIESVECTTDNMRQYYNPETRHTMNQEGVQIKVPGFGSSSILANLGGGFDTDYFRNLIRTLSQLGYRDNVSMRGAPYDFRKGLNEFDEYYANLTELVTDTYKKNGNTKVVFIAHGTGSKIVTLFLNQQTTEFKDTHVKSLISMGGAFGGSLTPVLTYLQSFLHNPQYGSAQTFARNFSLAFAEYPSPAAFSKDYIIVQTHSKNYSLGDMKEFFLDLNQSVSWDMYQDNYPIVSSMKAPEVEVHCLYGNATSTYTGISYPNDDFPYGEPVQNSELGDGSVPQVSLKACSALAAKQNQPVYDVPIRESSHEDIIKFGPSFDYIKKVIRIN